MHIGLAANDLSDGKVDEALNPLVVIILLLGIKLLHNHLVTIIGQLLVRVNFRLIAVSSDPGDLMLPEIFHVVFHK